MARRKRSSPRPRRSRPSSTSPAASAEPSMLRRVLSPVGIAGAIVLVGALLVSGPAAAMPIIVKLNAGMTLTLDVDPGETIAQVKLKIQDRMDIPPDRQRFIYQGTPLDDDDRTLASYYISSRAVLHLVLHS